MSMWMFDMAIWICWWIRDDRNAFWLPSGYSGSYQDDNYGWKRSLNAWSDEQGINHEHQEPCNKNLEIGYNPAIKMIEGWMLAMITEDSSQTSWAKCDKKQTRKSINVRYHLLPFSTNYMLHGPLFQHEFTCMENASTSNMSFFYDYRMTTPSITQAHVVDMILSFP